MTVPSDTTLASVPLESAMVRTPSEQERRHREREEAGGGQPQRGQQRHPAEDDPQPAGEIQPEAAFAIQHLQPVLQREQQRGVVRVDEDDGQHAVVVEKVWRDFKFMKGVRRQAHGPSWCARRVFRGTPTCQMPTNVPDGLLSAALNLMRSCSGWSRRQCCAQPRSISQVRHVARRHELILGLDLFPDLPAHLGQCSPRHLGPLQPLPQPCLGLLVDFAAEILFGLSRTARDEHFVAQHASARWPAAGWRATAAGHRHWRRTRPAARRSAT